MSAAFFDITVRKALDNQNDVAMRSLTEGAKAIIIVNVASQ